MNLAIFFVRAEQIYGHFAEILGLTRIFLIEDSSRDSTRNCFVMFENTQIFFFPPMTTPHLQTEDTSSMASMKDSAEIFNMNAIGTPVRHFSGQKIEYQLD